MLAAATVAAILLVSPVAPANSPAEAVAGESMPAQARQPAPNAGPAREAMKKLDWLTGQWRGTADVQGPGGAMQLQQSEDVRLKVFDTALLIEGTGREPGSDAKPGEIVFQALAVITYDAAAKKYNMRAITERGSVDPYIEVKDKEVFWGFDVPGGAGEVRYHIRLDEQGRWHEVGEFSQDGQTWMKFLEMKLEREAAPTP